MDKYEFREEVKKDKKTQETQYIETDEHPVQSNEISHSRMSFIGQDGHLPIFSKKTRIL